MSAADLVLGTAFDLGVREVWVFVESLRRHYAGEVALLVSSRSPPELGAYLRRRGVRLLHFDSVYWMVIEVQLARYVRYLEFLRDAERRYGRILLSDVSDVMFQGHPFDGAPDGELVLFEEDQRWTVGRCPNNSRWVQNLYGDAGLALVRDQRICCSGTTLGGFDAMLEYLDKMVVHAHPDRVKHLPRLRGYDQGIHNVLLRSGQLPRARVAENGDFVLTLAHVPDDELALGVDGVGLTTRNGLPNIVHQYQYKGVTQAYVERRFPMPEPQAAR